MALLKDPVKTLTFERISEPGGKYIPATPLCVELVRKHMKGCVDMQLCWGKRSNSTGGGPTLRVKVEVLAGAEAAGAAYLTESRHRAAWAAFEAECDAHGVRVRAAS